MKPTIINYDFTDHDPIDKWVPDDVYDVDFWMNFTIGPDREGGDNFQVRIVTPNNLHGKNFAKHAIVLNEYSWPKVIAEIEFVAGSFLSSSVLVVGVVTKQNTCHFKLAISLMNAQL